MVSYLFKTEARMKWGAAKENNNLKSSNFYASPVTHICWLMFVYSEVNWLDDSKLPD